MTRETADPAAYDLALFEALNEEYRDRPLVPRPLSHARASLAERGARKAAGMAKRYGLAGKRVLEIGCGRGDFADALARDHGCAVCGVDIVAYPEWERRDGGARFVAVDLAAQDAPAGEAAGEAVGGGFDAALSFAVWEHVTRPLEMLRRVHALLRPGGRLYFSANLHRGPKASHRYREVFFPFPHLLFPDAVFEAFYVARGGPPRRPAWINRLSAADYRVALEEVGFRIDRVWYDETPLDEAFYARFEDVLSRYPREDLQRDFIHVEATKP